MKLSIIFVTLALALFLVSWVNAREIGFIEDFSLSEDRSEVLKHLIPGTSDYYYYHCLNAQHTRDFERVHEMLELWIKREGYTRQVKEILNRQALLEYEQDSEKSLEHIRRELRIRFDHRKETAARETDYPTRLDQELIGISHLGQKAFSRYKNLQGIEDEGLDILHHSQLTPERRRDLLQRLQRPDIPDLAKLVVDDLKYKHSGGFGSHPIHRQLLKSQLDECLRIMPELIDNSEFINTCLSKLAPDDDVDLRYDLTEKKAYLDRLWGYAKDLAPAHNSLKAHVLFQILDVNRRQGNYDHDLFMTYIRLPRNVHYINPEYLKRREFHRTRADLDADFSSVTRMVSVVSDDELVRDYLSHYFKDAKNYKAYVKFIRDTWLREIFAETKIVNGIGDMEQWYSMMDPNRYKSLKERVDLEFAHTNKKFFSTDEPVSLELYVKNISTLIVKIFEINTFNYYQSELREVDTAISLDGLTAAYERVNTYDEPRLRRIRRNFDFPEIKGPGVFVVEFIGAGRSSRAVIRKGKLSYTDRIGTAGHEFVVRDEMNQKRPEAVIWIEGREYAPDEDGIIIIPFSNKPGRQKIILKEKDFCSLASFNHLSENYSMSAGFYADRESLLKGFKAKVIVRPVLSLNGHPVSLSLLKNVRLSIESVDRDGVSSVREVSDFEVFEEKESVFEFQVPDKLAKISFALKASVQNMSRNKKEDLSDHAEFQLNGIDTTLAVDDVFLSRVNDEHVLEFLGKNGEPKPGFPVKCDIKHRYFRERVIVSLQTDSSGQVHLGSLENIEWVRARAPQGKWHNWHLPKERCRYPANIHGQAGETIRTPYMGDEKNEPRLSYALFEKRGRTFFSDRKDAIRIRDGFMEISGLPAGNYVLFLKKSGAKINLRLTDGESEDGFVISERRVLETKNVHPLHISSIESNKSSVTLRLENASESARVHVFASRFIPSFDLFPISLMRNFRSRIISGWPGPSPSMSQAVTSGMNIATFWIGNMLKNSPETC